MSGQTGLENGPVPGGGTGPASILPIENLEEEAISTPLNFVCLDSAIVRMCDTSAL